MEFSVDDKFLWCLAFGVIMFVTCQSVFFLIRALGRAKDINLPKKDVRKIIYGTAIFSIAPALTIIIGVVTLSKMLGTPVAWFRLNLVGSLSFEIPAISATASVLDVPMSEPLVDPVALVSILLVMAIGIIPGVLLSPFLAKKVENSMLKVKKKDNAWGEIFTASLFIGMMSGFIGMIFAHVGEGITGWIPVCVFAFSALLMVICEILINKLNWKWLSTYSLAIGMLGGMAFACFITPIMGG